MTTPQRAQLKTHLTTQDLRDSVEARDAAARLQMDPVFQALQKQVKVHQQRGAHWASIVWGLSAQVRAKFGDYPAYFRDVAAREDASATRTIGGVTVEIPLGYRHLLLEEWWLQAMHRAEGERG